MENLPMKPAGKVISVRILPSTLIVLCLTIFSTSHLVIAYLSLFLNMMIKGKDSRSL